MKRRIRKPTKTEKKIFAFLTLFGFTSIALKLLDVIDWSWWLVTLVFWIIPSIILTPFIIAIACGLVVLSFKTLVK